MGNNKRGVRVPERCLDLINEDPRHQWSPVTLCQELNQRARESNRSTVTKASVKVALSRLARQHRIEKPRRGFYKGHEEISTTYGEKLEVDLWSAQADKEPFKIHNLQFIYKATTREGNKTKGPPSAPHFLLDPSDARGLLCSWQGEPCRSSPKEGTRYRYEWDQGRNLELAFWGNGSIGLYIESSSRPLDGESIRGLITFLDALMRINVGYPWSELDDFFKLQLIETNHDTPIENVQMAGLGRLNVTFRSVTGEIIRIYEKQLEQGLVLRREIVSNQIEEGGTLTDAAQQLFALMGGLDGSMMQMMAHKNYSQLNDLGREMSRQAHAASRHAEKAYRLVEEVIKDRQLLIDALNRSRPGADPDPGISPGPDPVPIPTPEFHPVRIPKRIRYRKVDGETRFQRGDDWVRVKGGWAHPARPDFVIDEEGRHVPTWMRIS